ncbi:hypothetical protein K0M31_014017 [Melipona bicolor]|uniref:Uncharacterized protein n=1 Tax=Melipona bicolor TaxID=60889 RepID=A0AA40KTW4_9HYME|nr:hypothetical protein K0M31_014017 [Melipona bicolor]
MTGASTVICDPPIAEFANESLAPRGIWTDFSPRDAISIAAAGPFMVPAREVEIAKKRSNVNRVARDPTVARSDWKRSYEEREKETLLSEKKKRKRKPNSSPLLRPQATSFSLPFDRRSRDFERYIAPRREKIIVRDDNSANFATVLSVPFCDFTRFVRLEEQPRHSVTKRRRDQPGCRGCLNNESTFPSGTGRRGSPAVVFGGENVGVPADEEGDSVAATPFQLPSGGSIRDGGWCAQLTLALCEPKSESLFGDPEEKERERETERFLMKMKGNP